MKIHLVELFYEQDDVQVRKELPPCALEYMGECYQTKGNLSVCLDFHKVNEKEVFLQGNAEYELFLPCDRCLEKTNHKMSISFAGDIQLQQDGEFLDLEELMREEVILNFPQKVLCKEDCLGICPDCGQNRNKTACDCHMEKPVDIRFAGLKELFENEFKEV